ncbi:hypothetical protein [Fervidibacter sacchari]
MVKSVSIRYSLFAIRCSPFAVHHSPFAIRCRFTIRQSLIAIRRRYGSARASPSQIPCSSQPIIDNATESKPCYGLQSVVDDEKTERRL